jgi:hypothetical protein
MGKAKGLVPDSDAYKRCIGQELGSGPGKPNVPEPNARAQAAPDACKSAGLTSPSDEFKRCVEMLRTTPGRQSEAEPKLEAAWSACIKNGVKPGTAPFIECVQRELG